MSRKLPQAAAMVCAGVGTGWLFSTYALVDWTGTGRYFGPYLPMAVILLWVGLVEASRRLFGTFLSESGFRGLVVAYAAALCFIAAVGMSKRLSSEYAESYPGYVATTTNLVAPCLWMRDHLPADAVIATRRIGAVGYYTQGRVFDYKFGLIHKEVAQLVDKEGMPFDDPNHEALRGIWRSVGPDYLLEDLHKVKQFAEDAGGTVEEFEIHGMCYRLIKQFPIGQDEHWALCKRVPWPG